MYKMSRKTALITAYLVYDTTPAKTPARKGSSPLGSPQGAFAV